jgi:hypothetical protein
VVAAVSGTPQSPAQGPAMAQDAAAPAPRPESTAAEAPPVQAPPGAPVSAQAVAPALTPTLAPAATTQAPLVAESATAPVASAAPAPAARGTPRHAPAELSSDRGTGFGLRSVDAAVASAVEAARALRNGEGHVEGPRMQLAAPPDTSRSDLERAALSELAQGVAERALTEREERTRDDDSTAIAPPTFAEGTAQFGASAGGQTGADQQHDPAQDTPDATPLPLPSQVQDAADAIWLRGNAPRAAAVSLEHPELGPMNLVVQQQGERVDVRAMLETPRAANILRAQESALKYGLQQAGMTLGSLRVRTREETTTPARAREIVRKRRGEGREA